MEANSLHNLFSRIRHAPRGEIDEREKRYELRYELGDGLQNHYICYIFIPISHGVHAPFTGCKHRIHSAHVTKSIGKYN